jgi:hypothetical protein
VLKQRKFKALKAYLGYLHYEPYSPGYRRYFTLAAKFNIPVITAGNRAAVGPAGGVTVNPDYS